MESQELVIGVVPAAGGGPLRGLVEGARASSFPDDFESFAGASVRFENRDAAESHDDVVLVECPPPPGDDDLEGWVTDLKRRLGDTGAVRLLYASRDSWPTGARPAVLEAVRRLSPYPVRLAIPGRHGSDRVASDVLGAAARRQGRLRSLLTGAFGTSSSALARWPQTLADGTHIPRPEAATILRGVSESLSTTHLLVGGAGTGKSALLGRVAQGLADGGVPTLAVKADALSPGVRTGDDLRAALSLPFSADVCVQALALSGPVAVLVDQLDAVSLLVDVQTGRLDVLLGLIARVSGLAGVHVAASTRPFERVYDERLRSIKATEMALSPLPRDAVSAALVAAGAPPLLASDETPSAWLLRLVTERPPPAGTPIQLQPVLSTWWDEVVSTGHPARADVLGRLTREIAREEAFWVDRERVTAEVEGGQVALGELIAEDVVTPLSGQPGRVGYRHQTVYSFSLARGLARGEATLSDHVLGAKREGLFVRQDLLATLAYLRETDPSSYERELTALLDGSPRRHIRALLLQWLGSQGSPSAWERGTVEELLGEDDGPALLAALATVPDSLRWLAPTAAFRSWVGGDLDRARFALPLVVAAARESVPEARGVVAEHWAGRTGFEPMLASVLRSLSRWEGSDVDWLVRVVQAEPETSVVYELGQKASVEDALRVFRASLDRALAAAVDARDGEDQAKRDAAPGPVQARVNALVEQSRRCRARTAARLKGQAVPSDLELSLRNVRFDMSALGGASRQVRDLLGRPAGMWQEKDLVQWARETPAAYLDAVWPWARRVLDAVEPLSGGIRIEYDERVSLFRQDGLEPEAASDLLFEAVGRLAERDADAFVAFAAEHDGDETRFAQALLAHGWAQSGRGPEALAFLLGDPRRMVLGEHPDEHRYTKALIAMLAETLDGGDLYRLERALDAYRRYPRPIPGDVKLRRDRRAWERRDRVVLLRAIPPEHRSPQVQRWVGEGERLFPDLDGRERSSVRFRETVWRVPPVAMAEMSDDDLVRLFDDLDDSTDWDSPRARSSESGGVVEQGRAFAQMAAAHPERALTLLGRLDPSRHKTYAVEGVSGLAEGGLSASRLMGAVVDLDARGFFPASYQGRVASALGRAAKASGLPDASTDLLWRWLTTNPEPSEPTDSYTDEERVPSGSVLFVPGGSATVPHGRGTIVGALIDGWLRRSPPTWGRVLDAVESRLPPTALWAKLRASVARRAARAQRVGGGPPAGDGQAMVYEAHAAVWAHTMLHAFSTVNDAPERLTAVFDRALRAVPEVWSVGFTAHLVARAMGVWTPEATVRRWLDALRASPLPRRRQLWGELWAVACAARADGAFTFAEGLENLDPVARRGLGYGAVESWGAAARREDAAAALATIIRDARAPAATQDSRDAPESWDGVDRLLREGGLFDPLSRGGRVVLEALADRPDVAVRLANRLARVVPSLVGPDATAASRRLAVRVLRGLGQACGRLPQGSPARWRAASALGTLLPVALTLHRLPDPELQEAGLDLFEEAIALQPEAADAIQRAVDQGLGAGESLSLRDRSRRPRQEF